MFRFFKRKALQILAPVEGQIVKIEDVPDEVFAKKILGEGIAIMPSSGEYVSPISGELVTVHPHAYGIRHNSGLQLLLHIGIDTINLKGEGFKVFCKENSQIEVGNKLVKVDIKKISPKVKSLISPIVIIPDSIEGREIVHEKFTDENGSPRQVKQGDLLMTIQ